MARPQPGRALIRSMRFLAHTLGYNAWLAAATMLATPVGVGLSLSGNGAGADIIWDTVTAVVLVPLTT